MLCLQQGSRLRRKMAGDMMQKLLAKATTPTFTTTERVRMARYLSGSQMVM